MKKILKQILKYYLKLITKIVLFIHRPTIIAIAGATNKTFVKNRVKQTLQKNGFNVQANPKNFNTEIGLPLAILYLSSGYNYYRKWLPIIFKAPLTIFQTNFPKYLVLELGVSNIGDMNYLLTIIKPKVTIITDITSKYLEGFNDMDQLVGEYQILAKKTNSRGILILNNDNSRVKTLSDNASAQKIFFGFQSNSDPRVVNVKRGGRGEIATTIHDGKQETYTLDRFGGHHVYALMVSLIINKYFPYEENKKKKFSKKQN